MLCYDDPSEFWNIHSKLWNKTKKQEFTLFMDITLSLRSNRQLIHRKWTSYWKILGSHSGVTEGAVFLGRDVMFWTCAGVAVSSKLRKQHSVTAQKTCANSTASRRRKLAQTAQCHSAENAHKQHSVTAQKTCTNSTASRRRKLAS